MELTKSEQSKIDVLTWEVEGIEIVDKPSSELAQELRNKCHERIKSIKEFCLESVNTAHKAWKAALKQQGAFIEPLETLKTTLTTKLKRYADEEMEKERAAQARIEKIQREAREKAAEGPEDGPQEPLYSIPVTVKSTFGKGWRDSWDWTVEDESLIPKEYWIIDSIAITAMVRAQKDKCVIPGIKVTKGKVPVSR